MQPALNYHMLCLWTLIRSSVYSVYGLGFKCANLKLFTNEPYAQHAILLISYEVNYLIAIVCWDLKCQIINAAYELAIH